MTSNICCFIFGTIQTLNSSRLYYARPFGTIYKHPHGLDILSSKEAKII